MQTKSEGARKVRGKKRKNGRLSGDFKVRGPGKKYKEPAQLEGGDAIEEKERLVA